MLKSHHLWRSWKGEFRYVYSILAEGHLRLGLYLDRPQLKITYDGGSPSQAHKKSLIGAYWNVYEVAEKTSWNPGFAVVL